MKRKLIDQLIEWKDKEKRKPVLLQGVKGVGKTYLSFEFARTFFPHVLYLNFEHHYKAEELISGFDAKIIYNNLLHHFNVTPSQVEAGEVIFIFDEVTSKPHLFECLNGIIEHINIPYLILITSNLPNVTASINSYESLTLYPLSFDEFLLSTSNEWYIETIKYHFKNHKPIPVIVHKELLALFQLYLRIGGMPYSMNEYLSLNSIENLAEGHEFLTNNSLNGFNKYYDESEALKINQVFQVLGLQLVKDNRKFQYRCIRKGTTQAMYQGAIQALDASGIILPCYKLEQIADLKKSEITEADIQPHISNSSFKLYLHDTGLLFTNMVTKMADLLDETAMRGLLENFVAQALHSNGYSLFYWESGTTAKVEFMLLKENSFIPIEVRSNNKTRSKNTSILKQSIDFPYAIKISTRNFELKNGTLYIPFYAVFCI